MNWDLAALVPLTSAVFYLALLRLVGRRASVTSGRRAFAAYLGFLAFWSLASTTWRLSLGTDASEPLLRVLMFAGAVGVPASFLLFVQAMYPTRWSRRVRVIVVGAVAWGSVGVLGGAFGAVVGPDPVASPHPILAAIAYGTLLAMMFEYALGAAYLVFVYRANRDPFERNRMKYVGIAPVLVMCGALTNMSPTLQALPLDQGINAAAAGLLAFSVVRYRLFNIDVALRRGAIQVAVSAVVAPLYVVLIALALGVSGWSIQSPAGFALAASMGPIAGMFAAIVRGTAERAVDRLLVGGSLDKSQALAELTRRASEVGAVDELVRDITERAQLALDSSFVALLMLDEEDQRFRLAHVSGPFPRPQPEWTIATDNTLFHALAAGGEPQTPFAVSRLVAEREFPSHQLAEFAPYRDCIVAPLLAQGEPVALLFVAPKVYDAAFTLVDLEFVAILAGQAALSLQNGRLFEQLREAAETDFVTGLPNHRYLQDLFQATLAAAEESGEGFCVAMADVDNFKLFNDVHGHQVGDDALRRLAMVVSAELGERDIVGRYGGDEFLFILRGRTKEEGRDLLSQVSRRVRKTSLAASEGDLSASERLPARISWGLAAYPEDGVTRRNLTSVADSQLLQRKIEMRRSGTVHTERPTTGRLLERDPEKLRIARALLDIIDAKDPYTSEHSQQIASFALLLADELGMGDSDRYALWLGSLLHDVGKIGTPSEILRKPGRLTPEEWDLMRLHPALGESMVRGLLDIEEVIEIVGCHHERFDGSGYPRGLVGEDIPRLARLVTVADAFSAMVHDRPYRKGLTWDEATVELRQHAGTQFDPAMVEVFIKAIGHDERKVA